MVLRGALLLLAYAAAPCRASCVEYYAGKHEAAVAPAKQWCAEGAYFTYNSPANEGKAAEVFWRCRGGAGAAPKTVVVGHGWPTSSFDYAPLSAIFEAEGYRVCGVDYVGAGFSDKPQAWRYHISDHAHTIHTFLLRQNITEFAYVTHDEGASVGLALLDTYAAYAKEARPYTITHHVILDGSVYLPLANLTKGQELLLSNVTGPAAQYLIPPGLLALGMAHSVYSPPLDAGAVAALASVFEYQHGPHVFHQTIQYLVDRKEHEDHWLDVLHEADVPATLLWGAKDPVAKLAIADYVWANYLHSRPHANATYHVLDDANHYLHVDHTRAVADVILQELPQ